MEQATIVKGVFNVVVSDEEGMVKFYEEEEEEWIIQKEIGKLACAIIDLTMSNKVLFLLSATPFCCGV